MNPGYPDKNLSLVLRVPHLSTVRVDYEASIIIDM